MTKPKVDSEVKQEIRTNYVANINIKYGEIEVKMGQEFEVAPQDIEELVIAGIIDLDVE